MATQREFVPVTIIGAGFSGLAMGCQLKTQLDFHDYVIYERHEELGGTWYANQYPGCGVDVPAVFYSLSFAPNPNFSQLFPNQPEILQYMRDVAKEYGVDRHIKYNLNWESSKWQSKTKTWRNQFRNVKTNEIFEQECKILISGTGGFIQPQKFELEGLENFKGRVVHSARWEKDIDLKDKDVVVVGNGCSASQIVPAIADKASHVYQFMRTPQYFVPRINPPISDSWKFCFRYLPGFYTFLRWLTFLLIETDFKNFYLGEAAAKDRAKAQAQSKSFIDRAAPEEYRALLKPQFEIGCKRRIFDPGYIASLHRPNVFLTDDRLVSATEKSIVTKSGKHYPADIIVLANGFALWRCQYPLIGVDGAKVEDHWETFGGPEAYKTTAMANFPNFFMLLGPNSASGHTSVLFSIENSIMLIIRIIRPLLRKKYKTIEVKPEAEKTWVQQIQSALKQRVWADNCNTYYVDQKSGWNFAMYPFSSFHLWWINRFPKMEHWKYDVGN